MNNIILSSKFKRKYRKLAKNNQEFIKAVDQVIDLLEIDVSHPKLKLHSLYGQLSGLHAITCGYDCRIVLKIYKKENHTDLLLLDIGTHDEVY